jgi:hypothetical protein
MSSRKKYYVDLRRVFGRTKFPDSVRIIAKTLYVDKGFGLTELLTSSMVFSLMSFYYQPQT